MSEERFDRIDERFDGIENRADRLETGQADLTATMDAGFSKMDARFTELSQHMHLLHEDMIERLKDASERDVPTNRLVNERLADEREETNRRLDPLEAAVRRHSKEIDRLKGRRG